MSRRGATFARFTVLGFCIAAAAPDAGAQGSARQTAVIRGRIVSADGRALPFSTASIEETGHARFSNDAGEFVLGIASPGTYRLRFRQLGFAPFDTLVAVSAGLQAPLHIVLKPIAFRLATVTVRSRPGCFVPGEGLPPPGSEFALVFDELQKNAERERLLVREYPFEYRLTRSTYSDNNRVADPPNDVDTSTYRSDARPRYVPGRIVRLDTIRVNVEARLMLIPVLADLADTDFLRTHCYSYRGLVRVKGVSVHRVDFRPTAAIQDPDVEGSVFLDPASFVIRRAVFRLTRPDRVSPPVSGLEMTTTYREIFPGVTVVGEVNSGQRVSSRGISGMTAFVTERQKLVDFRFLRGQPGDSVARR
ncbi:MAG: carboxypeptidase-like regulatory domain-containing protein [Gemmatimonadaceae bacterium]|nr:carboxypeptidase-like regulatory domain-containing protein [Gemmatimonadaceae bacterium]